MAYPTRGGKFRVSCPFGVKGPQWMSGWHQGIDFAGPEGEPVFAVADGVVLGAGIWGSAFGKDAVVIKHKFRFRSYYCVYGHMSASLVKAGQSVKLGQQVGKIGKEGNASGPHLHFEMQKTPRWTVGGGIDPKWALRYKG